MMRHYGSRAVPIDPEIKGLLAEYNKRGYKTEQSCAGHGHRGYISFVSKNKRGFPQYLTKEEARDVINIARNYGCKRVGFPPSRNAGGVVYATIEFAPMGKTRR